MEELCTTRSLASLLLQALASLLLLNTSKDETPLKTEYRPSKRKAPAGALVKRIRRGSIRSPPTDKEVTATEQFHELMTGIAIGLAANSLYDLLKALIKRLRK